MIFVRPIAIFAIFLSLNSISRAQGIDSAWHFKSSSTSSIAAAVSDNHGNLFVAGFFQDSLWLNDQNILTGQFSSPTLFVSSFDSDGKLRWAKSIFTNVQTRVRMETDDSGNLYLGALCYRNAYLDRKNLKDQIYTGSGPQAFILKMNSEGDNKWFVNTVGNTGQSKVDFLDFTLSKNNELLWMVTGMGDLSFTSSTNLNAGPFNLGDKLVNRPGVLVIRNKLPLNRPFNFIAKFSDPNGLISGYSIVEREGKIVFSGDYYGPIDMDPGTGTKNLSGSGGYYCCVDTAMQFQWVRKSTLEQVVRMKVNSFNQIKAFGYESGIGSSSLDIGSLGFDGKIHFENRSSFTKTGTYISDVDADRAGNVFVSGSFNGSGDFDPTNQTRKQFSSRISTFLAKYDSSNALEWIVIGRGTAEYGNWGNAVDISSDNKLTWGGSYNKAFGIVSNSHIKFPNVTFTSSYLTFSTECKSLKATMEPNSNLICIGDSARIQIKGAQSAWWNHDSSNSLSRVFSPKIRTKYIAEVSDGLGCFTKVDAQIDVAPLPEPKILISENKVICEAYWRDIQWYLNDKKVIDENDTTFYPAASGLIYCMVRDSNSCSGKSNEVVFEHIAIEELFSMKEHLYFANGRLFLPKNCSFEDFELSVWDIAGKRVFTTITRQGESQIAFTTSPGTYIAILKSRTTGGTIRKKITVAAN